MLIWIDPRLILIINNSTVIALGLCLYHLQRSPLVILSSLFVAVFVELLLHRWYPRVKVANLWDRVLSAVPSALSILIMLKLFRWWLYPALVGIAIISKYTIQLFQGRHVFNPTNFAIVFAYTFVPVRYITLVPDQFSLNIIPVLITFTLGSFAVVFAKRWILPLIYLLATLAISIFLDMFWKIPFIEVFGPEVGVSGLIFIFFMMTDPRTSPSKNRHQVFFGFVIALITIFLRLNEILAAQFLSLFFVSAIYAFYMGWVRKST